MISTVQIVGMREHSRTNHLLQNVEAALQALHSPLVVQCVTDIEELIRLQIEAIPTLLLDGQIICQKEILSVPDLICIFQQQAKKTYSSCPE